MQSVELKAWHTVGAQEIRIIIIFMDQKGKGEEKQWGLQLAALLPFPLLPGN